MEEQLTTFEQTKLIYELWKTIFAGLSLLVTLLVTYFGYRWAQRNWFQQKEKERNLEQEKMRYNDKVASAKAVWSLLAYMSQKENDKTVFVARGNKETKAYYLREEQGKKFLVSLTKVFYEEGHGILMTKKIRDKIFDFRTQVYRTLDWKRQNPDLNTSPEGLIKVRNDKVIPKINEIRESLLAELRLIITQ